MPMVVNDVPNPFIPGYANFNPVDSSLLRKIRHIVCKVLIDFWVSVASYFMYVATDNQLDTPGIKQLIQTRALQSAAVVEYGQYLESQNPALQFVTQQMFGLVLPNLQPNKNDVAIPVILKGCVRDHIVMVFVDRRSNVLEYYDSKGLTIQDRNDPELNEVLQQALEKYGDANTRLIENTEKHQYDSHNCGVYILDYVFRRKTEAPEQIFANGFGPCAANRELRARMIFELNEAAAL